MANREVFPKWMVCGLTATILFAVARQSSEGGAGQVPGSTKDAPFPKNAEAFVTRRTTRLQVLDLEDAISRSELIVAVRLVEMTESKIVHGGESEVVTQQFRFEPVRTLKGIFARDALLLTGQDLGIYQFGDAADKLQRGQMLLLLLGRQGPGYFNCNSAGSIEQSLPRLKDQADPLLPAVESLIAVTHKRDRAAKVAEILGALEKASDRDALPLLVALRRRSLIAVQTPDAIAIVARFLGNPSSVVRETAARTLADMLDSDYLEQKPGRELAVKALVPALDSADADLGARIAEIDALGSAGTIALQDEKALPWLSADRAASTFAEHGARLRAIGRSGRKDQAKAVAIFYDGLPLDAPIDVQNASAISLGKLDPEALAKKLTARIINKSDRGIPFASEIALIADLPKEVAVPALLAAFSRVEDHAERVAYAGACTHFTDARLVASLALLLDPRYNDVRWLATEALRRIDTDEAASVVWPHLAQETDLARKLVLAEFLGRHGFRGGYPYAIEHMSSAQLQDDAINALASIREPRAVPELRKIWESSNDLGWNAAAIRALGRLGQDDIAPRLLEIVGDLRNPLAGPSLIALADLGEAKALPILDEALNSRNDLVVIASIRAARKLLAAPEIKADKTRDRIAALLADPDATQLVREAALQTLAALNDPRLADALRVAVRDGGSEGSELLRKVEAQLTTRKQKLAAK